MNVIVNGRQYTVAPAGPDELDNVIAELFNSRGKWVALVVRDPARQDNYVLAGSAFKRVSASEHRQVGRAIARELSA